MQFPGIDVLRIKQRQNRFYCLVSGREEKTKNHARVILFHPFVGTSTLGAIALNFGILADITDITTRAKFCDSRFRGFGVLKPPICHSR